MQRNSSDNRKNLEKEDTKAVKIGEVDLDENEKKNIKDAPKVCPIEPFE